MIYVKTLGPLPERTEDTSGTIKSPLAYVVGLSFLAGVDLLNLFVTPTTQHF